MGPERNGDGSANGCRIYGGCCRASPKSTARKRNEVEGTARNSPKAEAQSTAKYGVLEGRLGASRVIAIGRMFLLVAPGQAQESQNFRHRQRDKVPVPQRSTTSVPNARSTQVRRKEAGQRTPAPQLASPQYTAVIEKACGTGALWISAPGAEIIGPRMTGGAGRIRTLDLILNSSPELRRKSRARRSFHAPVCPKPAITLSRKDWHSVANRAVL